MSANPLAGLPRVAIQTVVNDLVATFTAAQATNIGFPAATDFDFTPLAPLLRFMVNNLGDPKVNGAYPIHTKAQERAAVDIIADLLHAPVNDRWGYVTSGASEGTEYALHLARTRFPDAFVYHSTAVHHSVVQVIDRLRMRSISIRTDARGEVNYDDLTDQLDRRRDRPAIVVATIGSGITEAVDDVRRIARVLQTAVHTRRWIHADAALSGIPLSLMEPAQRPGFDFADGADSVVLSAHKFVGSPVPAAAVVVRNSLRPDGGRVATYTGAPNSTVANSRSGFAALALWYALHEHGPQWQQRASDCRELAAYACRKLIAIGVDAWRHPHALTVVLPTPPTSVAARWVLGTDGGTSHIICVPGVTRQHIDALVTEIKNASKPPAIPRQRNRRIPGLRIGAAP